MKFIPLPAVFSAVHNKINTERMNFYSISQLYVVALHCENPLKDILNF